MSKFIFSSTRIKAEVEAMLLQHLPNQTNEELFIWNIAAMVDTYTSKVSEDTGWGPDISSLLDIATQYATLASIKVGKDEFFKNVARCYFCYSYDSVNECYLLDKLAASAKKSWVDSGWEPSYNTYALLQAFINDIGSYSNQQDDDNTYEEVDQIFYDISYFDRYQNITVEYKNLELYKIDVDRYIFDIDHAYLVIQNNKAVILTKPVINSFKDLIDPNIYFSDVALPIGFDVIYINRI